MATFAFSTMAFPQGATFVFGLWFCVGNGSSGFDSHLTNPIEPEAISSESYNTVTGSDDHGDMLLPDLAKEIEQKVEDKSGSTRTQIDFSPNSTRVGSLLARPIFGLRNASSTYHQKIKSIYSSYEDSLDQTLAVENFSATTSGGGHMFSTYTQIQTSHPMIVWIPSFMRRQNFNSNPTMATHLQNYSITFEKLPASTIFRFNTVPPLHPYGKLDPGEPN
jgi:hypothetical protein